MANALIGGFYFKQTDSGNLIGEFFNNAGDRIFTKSATVIDVTEEIFIGEYDAAWKEDELQEATLNISCEGDKYLLEWYRDDEKIYTGEGILVDEILCGYYYEGE